MYIDITTNDDNSIESISVNEIGATSECQVYVDESLAYSFESPSNALDEALETTLDNSLTEALDGTDADAETNEPVEQVEGNSLTEALSGSDEITDNEEAEDSSPVLDTTNVLERALQGSGTGEEDTDELVENTDEGEFTQVGEGNSLENALINNGGM